MNHTNTTSPFASQFTLARLALALGAALALTIGAPALARAQAPLIKSEAEHLVPPQGSAAEVPVHLGKVCILSFPEKISPRAISSSSDFEIQPWRDDGVAVRAVNKQTTSSTLALATVTGLIKVNVTLRVVPDTEPAVTLVRFKAVSETEAFDAQVKAGVANRVAPIERRLAAMRKDLDALIRRRSDRQIAERLLRRGDVVKLKTHARNRDHVILHVWRGLLLGDDGYLVFEIENRSGAPYHLASVRVIADGRNLAHDVHLAATITTTTPMPTPTTRTPTTTPITTPITPTTTAPTTPTTTAPTTAPTTKPKPAPTTAPTAKPKLTPTTAPVRDPALIGVIAPGTTARGIVTFRPAQPVLRRPLALEISMPNGRSAVRIDRGIVLR